MIRKAKQRAQQRKTEEGQNQIQRDQRSARSKVQPVPCDDRTLLQNLVRRSLTAGGKSVLVFLRADAPDQLLAARQLLGHLGDQRRFCGLDRARLRFPGPSPRPTRVTYVLHPLSSSPSSPAAAERFAETLLPRWTSEWEAPRGDKAEDDADDDDDLLPAPKVEVLFRAAEETEPAFRERVQTQVLTEFSAGEERAQGTVLALDDFAIDWLAFWKKPELVARPLDAFGDLTLCWTPAAQAEESLGGLRFFERQASWLRVFLESFFQTYLFEPTWWARAIELDRGVRSGGKRGAEEEWSSSSVPPDADELLEVGPCSMLAGEKDLDWDALFGEDGELLAMNGERHRQGMGSEEARLDDSVRLSLDRTFCLDGPAGLAATLLSPANDLARLFVAHARPDQHQQPEWTQETRVCCVTPSIDPNPDVRNPASPRKLRAHLLDALRRNLRAAAAAAKEKDRCE